MTRVSSMYRLVLISIIGFSSLQAKYTNDEENAYKAGDSDFTFNKNAIAMVRSKKSRVYSFPSDNADALEDKSKGEMFEIDGCNLYEWCKIKDKNKYLRKFRLIIENNAVEKVRSELISEEKSIVLKELKTKTATSESNRVSEAKEKNQMDVPREGKKQVDKQKQKIIKVKKAKLQSKEVATKKETSLPRVLVKKFNITGNTMVTTSELESYLQVFQNKRLTFKELQDVVRDISNYYRTKGFTSRTLLPPQEIVNGEIKVVILEGNLSAIEIDADNLKRLSSTKAKHIIEKAHPVGEKLQTKKLERGLLLLNDTPGIISSASIVAGEKAGDSKLKLKVEDANLIDLFVSYANSGAKSTGRDELTLSSNINSPFAFGEQITLQGMTTEGIKYIKGGFSVPVLDNGLKIGADASMMTYDVINGTDADGNAQTYSIWASYPLLRSQKTNLNFIMSYDEKYYLNRSSGTTISDKTNKGVSLTLSGNHYDDNGQTSIRTTFTRAKLDLSGVDSDYATDQMTAQKHGVFSKFYMNAYRTQILSDTLYITLSATLQKANKNLESGEKLYLGGASGVRAYPANEAAGDEGYILNAEIVKSFNYAWSAGLFYDLGEIKQNKILYTGWQGLSTAGNSYKLKGVGININYYYETWSAKASYALKDGENPNPQADGSDNDGTDKNHQVWLQFMKMF